jgi:MFS family permease
MDIKKRTLSILIFTDSFFNMSSLILVPIFAVYVISLGGDVRHIGELYAVYAVVFGIVGWIAAKYYLKKRRVVGLGYLFWIIYSLILVFNDSLAMFYVAQVFAGTANAIRYPFLQQSITDHSNGEIAQFYKTVYEFAGQLAGAILAILVAHYVHHNGFHAVFIAMACLAALSFVLAIYYYLHLNKHQDMLKR